MRIRTGTGTLIAALIRRGLSVWRQVRSGDLEPTVARGAWVRLNARIGRQRGGLLQVVIDGVSPPEELRSLPFMDLSQWNGRIADPRIDETVALQGSPDYGEGYPATPLNTQAETALTRLCGTS